jgi:poly-gamma-glutamate synthesis protein (capsule biosynthesis protein)
LAFTFAPASAKALSSAGVTAVSLANNHAYNFGAEGVAETKKWLKQSGVQWFGNPWNTSSTELVVNKNGMNIAFVGYHAFEPGVEKVIADVKRLSQQGDFVIIMPHWGTEYSATPTDKIREQAKAFIAAGAKAIIGSHPHVIMENETIAGVPVYYSVGNLLFDQYFSPEVMKGEIVSLKLVNGPSGPSIGDVQTYGVKLDRAEGVVLE